MLDPVSGTSTIKNNEDVFKLAEVLVDEYKRGNISESEYKSHVQHMLSLVDKSEYDDGYYCSPILRYISEVLSTIRCLSIAYLFIYLAISPITLGLVVLTAMSFSFTLFILLVSMAIPFVISIAFVVFIPDDKDDTVDLMMDVFGRLGGDTNEK